MSRGGARPGAGRKKLAEPSIRKRKSQATGRPRGGARPGAGRPKIPIEARLARLAKALADLTSALDDRETRRVVVALLTGERTPPASLIADKPSLPIGSGS